MDVLAALKSGKFIFSPELASNVNITAGNGDNKIFVMASDSNILAGNGDNEILLIGNDEDIKVGDGDNEVTFLGNDYDINAGDGDNTFQTLDLAIRNGEYENYSSYLDNRDIDRINQGILLSSNTTTAVVGTSSTNSSTSSVSGNIITTRTDTTTTTTYEDRTTNNYADEKQTILDTSKNINITTGNGDNDIDLNAQNVDINLGYGDNDVDVVNGIVLNSEYMNYRTTQSSVRRSSSTTSTSITQSSVPSASSGESTKKKKKKTGEKRLTTTKKDPLVIDFNQDGIVSVAAGKGVDLEGDGIADGCASNGDKMLAMTDLNGNGQIDGTEVFGDKTVNPFTGEALNAVNGFEALSMVAEAAEKYVGIECINEEGVVDLFSLNKALQAKGISLGFISDENNTIVEKLSKVTTIDTANYVEQNIDEDIEHGQLGIAIFEDGSAASVDNVWFNLSSRKNNL